MVKVLELIDTGFIGGGQIHILLLSKYISKNHFEISIASTPNGPFKTQVEQQGLKFFDVCLRRIFSIKAFQRLESIISSEKIEIVHSHGTVAGMYAKVLKKRNPHIKLLHSVHGYHYLYSPNPLKRKFVKLLERALVSYPDIYILLTDYEISLGLINKVIINNRTFKIPCGIELDEYSRVNRDPIIARNLGVKDNSFIIGNISRFDIQKNQRLLIEVFPEIIKNIPEAQLLLVGEGKLKVQCEQLATKMGISDRVIFAGARTDIKKIFPLINIFVFPSKWEGLSLTLMESMAAERCILASNIPSNRELIEENQNGLLFDLNNKVDLINKIIELYKKPKLRESFASNAKQSVKKFDVKQMATQIEKLYLSILKK
ncbi:MAG: glycosyltransferase [Ignavibacteria bacterium]